MEPKIETYRVQLPFTQNVAGIETTYREGALLKYSDHTIEVAPFPGFSKVELKVAVAEVTAFLKETKNPANIEDLLSLNAPVHCLFAILQRFDQQSSPISFFPKQNLLFGEQEWPGITPMQIEQRVLKLKLNTQNKLLLTWMRDNRDVMHERDVKLRLDTNARWSAEKLNTFWQELNTAGLQEYIDYFEEPLKRFDDYHLVQSDIPYIHEENIEKYLGHPTKACGVILKPSQNSWRTLMLKKSKRVIISSCWEGPFGISALKRLASLFPEETHGLSASIQY